MTGFPKHVRDIVVERADGACEVCWFAVPEQLHHRRPRGAGSSKRPDTNTASNALAVCAADHLIIEKHREIAFEYGWLVRQGHDPASVPVLRHHCDWVLLADDGSITEYREGA